MTAEAYTNNASAAEEQIADDIDDNGSDIVNFLGVAPCYPTSQEEWQRSK